MAKLFDPRARKGRDFGVSLLDTLLYKMIGSRAAMLSALLPEILDLSHWNVIDSLAEVKAAGIVGLIWKATEGVSFVDPVFEKFWPVALDLGFIQGVYHFFRSNLNGFDQANYHLDKTQKFYEATQGHVMPGWADVETRDGVDNSPRLLRLNSFLASVAGERGKAGVYSSPYLWSNLTGGAAMNDWGWVAHWTPGSFVLPTGWQLSKARLHQNGVYPKHSWVRYIPGIQGEVDHNLFMGSLPDLRAWVGLGNLPTLEERVESLERRVDALENR